MLVGLQGLGVTEDGLKAVRTDVARHGYRLCGYFDTQDMVTAEVVGSSLHFNFSIILKYDARCSLCSLCPLCPHSDHTLITPYSLTSLCSLNSLYYSLHYSHPHIIFLTQVRPWDGIVYCLRGSLEISFPSSGSSRRSRYLYYVYGFD
jgi:hypothetical protein